MNINDEAAVETNDDKVMFTQCHLSAILRFDEMVRSDLRNQTCHSLIFQGGENEKNQTQLSFLLGCHLIMTHGLGFEETYIAFSPLHELYQRLYNIN